MRATYKHVKAILSRLPTVVLLAHCGRGVDGDRLFLGTIAGSQWASGLVSVVVHNSDSSCSGALGGGTGGTANTVTTGIAGASQIVRGTVSSTARVLLSSGGRQLDGKLGSGGVARNTTGPSGTFSAVDATDDSVTRFCGTFSGADSGTGNLEVSSSEASGSFAGSFA